MTTDINEARDWQGKEIACEGCGHATLRAHDKCRPKRACVHDRYASRIDRFFDWNEGLANQYLDHPYFETRAVAAKYADVFHLPRTLDDPDETVRWSAAMRLPRSFLLRLRNDTHREVRIRVASRLEGADLVAMMGDTDYYVRMVVARRLPIAMLPLMARDPEREVRRVVVDRVDSSLLLNMVDDEDAEVRLAVARRLMDRQLGPLRKDTEWRVRYEVASRLPSSELGAMLDDPDPLVREMAQARRQEEAGPLRGGTLVVLSERRCS